MNDANRWLDLAFEVLGKGSRPDPVDRMPLGIFAQQCDRAHVELGVVPSPSDNAKKGLRLVRGLLFRAANIARDIDGDPTEHLRIAASFLSKEDATAALDRFYGGGRG